MQNLLQQNKAYTLYKEEVEVKFSENNSQYLVGYEILLGKNQDTYKFSKLV